MASEASLRLCERLNALVGEGEADFASFETPSRRWNGSSEELEAKLIDAIGSELHPETSLEIGIGAALRANLETAGEDK